MGLAKRTFFNGNFQFMSQTTYKYAIYQMISKVSAITPQFCGHMNKMSPEQVDSFFITKMKLRSQKN